MEDLGKTARIIDRSSNLVVQVQRDYNSPGVHQILAEVRQAAYKISSLKADHGKHNSDSFSAINTNGVSISSNTGSSTYAARINSLSQKNAQQNSYASSTAFVNQQSNYAINSSTLLADSASSNDNWKTINAKRDKRRKKPAEKKVLAGQIPGNLGDTKTIDELVNFIQVCKQCLYS